MKKCFPVFCIIILSVFSCEKDTMETCTANPLENLDWLKREIQSLEQTSLANYAYVQQAELLGLTVFIFGNCCPFCNTVTPVYSCQGEVICYLGGCDGLEDHIKNKQLIWHAQDFECNIE